METGCSWKGGESKQWDLETCSTDHRQHDRAVSDCATGKHCVLIRLASILRENKKCKWITEGNKDETSFK